MEKWEPEVGPDRWIWFEFAGISIQQDQCVAALEAS